VPAPSAWRWRRNQRRYSQHPELQQWFRSSRLEACSVLFEQAEQLCDPAWEGLQVRMRQARRAGLERLDELMRSAEAFPA
jgi:hypothetical protein